MLYHPHPSPFMGEKSLAYELLDFYIVNIAHVSSIYFKASFYIRVPLQQYTAIHIIICHLKCIEHSISIKLGCLQLEHVD